MFLSDLINVFQWWITISFIGIIFIPITSIIFSNFFDKGYVFAKVIGIAFLSYTIFILGFLKILPFDQTTIFIVIAFFAGINLLIFKKYFKSTIKQFNNVTIWTIFLEEIIFLIILFLWSFIHAHQPDIHGLEKYMDLGFINSVLRSEYFPPKDMWLTPYSINYYYFGHLITAVLTKISFLPSAITFNLMLATIAAISFTSAFSIGANLVEKIKNHLSPEGEKSKIENIIQSSKIIIGGLITAFILNFTGNLHTIYLFFKPYVNENPVPFWNLIFSPQTFPNNYWYPNATRFIHNTIHEFPIYSYVVSDLHGHVLDIPFVLLTIALLLLIFLRFNNHSQIQNSKIKVQNCNSKLKIFGPKLFTFNFSLLTMLAFLLAIMYMTNAWDGIIYFILSSSVIGYLIFKPPLSLIKIKNRSSKIKNALTYIIVLGVGFFLFALPFNLNFKPFASGIGIVCAPKFLTDLGKLGPFLFEPDHCQPSPFWQLGILYGFFYFWVISFIVLKIKNWKLEIRNLSSSDIFVGILIILSTLLIIIPEFIYVKDIYPAHYRANTMFKLVYQSFIMLSLSSGYIIMRLFLNHKSLILNQKFRYWLLGYWFIGLLILVLVFLYPYFAINSYFGNLKDYSGLNGTNYLRSLYPNDYEAILWINKNIKEQPVILEAQGDSYTDYARVSTNTGLPTVLGWTVHEWLWRGTYDIPAPRISDIQKIYELQDPEQTKILLKKYNVSLVFIGDLERQKYANLNEEKFQSLGKIIYQKGNTKILKLH